MMSALGKVAQNTAIAMAPGVAGTVALAVAGHDQQGSTSSVDRQSNLPGGPAARDTVAAEAQKAAQTPDGAYYGGAVKLVNQQLQDSGFGMTEASRNSVVTNLRKVSSGKMLNMQAHSREVETFAKDTKAKLQAGETADAALCATGVVANALGGGLASHLDGARLTAQQLKSQNPEDRAKLLSSLTSDFHSP